MSLPLDTGDQLIDRAKSAMLLYYLARAMHRVDEREIARKKVELSIKQLKKISTKDLHSHIEELEGHIVEAIHREKAIQGHQKGEESVHAELTHKITKLEGKLGKYLSSQEARKARIEELENKVKSKFESKKERIETLKQDLKKLLKLYRDAKHGKAPKEQLLRIARRMEQVKCRISVLR
jgi:chromosome segregation ATPase